LPLFSIHTRCSPLVSPRFFFVQRASQTDRFRWSSSITFAIGRKLRLFPSALLSDIPTVKSLRREFCLSTYKVRSNALKMCRDCTNITIYFTFSFSRSAERILSSFRPPVALSISVLRTHYSPQAPLPSFDRSTQPSNSTISPKDSRNVLLALQFTPPTLCTTF
jgi:hypothetical protein